MRGINEVFIKWGIIIIGYLSRDVGSVAFTDVDITAIPGKWG